MKENIEQGISRLRNTTEQFIKLTDDEFNMLVPHIKTRRLRRFELLAEIGKPVKEIGFVLDGLLRHYYLKDGVEKTTFFYFENELVGSYFSCITNRLSQITIEALTDCNLIVFPYKALLELYKTNKTWQEFGRLLAEYLAVCIEERMTDLLMHNPEERYLNLLKGSQNKLIERVPQHYIANFLGITAVSLSRIRNRVIKK